MPSSYNGWPASRDAAAIGIVPFEPLPGVKFPGGIKGGDVKTVFTYLVKQLNARVEKAAEYRPGDDWGYSYRANVNNPSVLSCHASGTAIDYNATQHPNQVDYTWTRAQVRVIHQIVNEELDGVIKWLEGYDEMHFEIRGNSAAVAAVARKIKAGMDPSPQPPDQPTPPPPEDDDMPIIIKAKGKATRLLDAPVFVTLDPVSLWNLAAAGVKQAEVTPADYDEIRAQIIKALEDE